MTADERFGLTMTAEKKIFGLTMTTEEGFGLTMTAEDRFGLTMTAEVGIRLMMTTDDILGTKVHEFARDGFWTANGKNYRGKRVNCLGLQ